MTARTSVLSLSLAAVAAFWSIPSPAEAYSVTWCAYFKVQYSDSNLPPGQEDHWVETSADTSKPLRGSHYIIRNATTYALVSEGYLYDGLNGTAGCTPSLTMAGGTYNLYVYSVAQVQGNAIEAGDTNGTTKIMATYSVPVSSNNTKSITFSPPVSGTTWEVFNVQQAITWALYRHAAALSGETFTVEVGNPTGCQDDEGSCASDTGEIYIDDSRINRKFRIVHEVGHALGHLRGIASAADYGYDGQGACILDACGLDDPPCGGTPDGWWRDSLEWVGAAVHEGFADFYSADVWNDHDETDCWMVHFPNSGFDCEGNGTYEYAWVGGSTCRVPDDPESGADIDWVRIFWDVHTDGAAPDPSFTQMARDWLQAAGDWNRDTAFTEINEQAQALDGDLPTNWEAAVGLHAPYYW